MMNELTKFPVRRRTATRRRRTCEVEGSALFRWRALLMQWLLAKRRRSSGPLPLGAHYD